MEGNTSSADPGFKESLSFKIFKITLYSIILLLCLIGNTMVVLIVCKTKRKRIPSNLLILNLAICDLITPITSIPFDFALEEKDYVWPFGRVLCKTLWPLATLSATAASLTLALISLDRYRIIMHPFKQRLSSKQVKLSIAFTHLLGLLFVLPYVYHLDLSAKTHRCEETWPAFSYRQAYTLFLFISQYGIPLAFMTIMYSITLLNLRASSNKFENPVRDNSRHQKMSLQVDDAVVNGNMNGSRLDIIRDFRKASRVTIGQKHDLVGRDQNVRATKMFVTVVIVFATCRLPNEIFWLWSDFGEGHESQDSNIAGIVCRMFTYTNSIFNPVIYWAFSSDFKKGFKELLLSFSNSKRNEIWDDDLDQDDRRFRKLSILSETISFVWRKMSRSRSETSYHQPSPVDYRGHEDQGSHCKRPCTDPSMPSYGDAPENVRKKSSLKTTQFVNDSFNHSLSPLPSQSKLAKLSEESLGDIGEELVNGNVRTRRFGTVQSPGEQRPKGCETIITITRPLSEIDPSFSNSKDARDQEINSSLSEKENYGTVSSLEITDTFENNKKEYIENIDNVCMIQSEFTKAQNGKECGKAFQPKSEGIFLSVESNDIFVNEKDCNENINKELMTLAEQHNEKDCDHAISSNPPVKMEISPRSSRGEVSSVKNKNNFADKEECVKNTENSEACTKQAAANKENDHMFLKQPILSFSQQGTKETNC